MKNRLAMIGLIAGLVCSQAMAWGEKGHRIVALVAEKSLSPTVNARVKQILGSSMADVASDADHLRGLLRMSPNGLDQAVMAGRVRPEDAAFIRDPRNAKNAEWHYCDLPLGARSYDSTMVGASDHDVVQLIVQCTQVLRHKSTRFSERDALRLLIHFVGDETMPLHVSCGYYPKAASDHAELISDPKKIVATGAVSDAGANALRFGETELHAYWDSALVDKAMAKAGVSSEDQFASLLLKEEPRMRLLHRSGPIDQWPAQWAGDSIRVARDTYKGIEFGKESVSERGVRIEIVLPANYDNHTKDVDAQLAKGGYRLAAILDAVYSTK